jgi:3-hydroxyisobutyrate dehydrogenase-like beta-hydroxyacid dehydrogenase
MGCAVGSALKSNGLDVITILSGRSELTRKRTADAGFRDFPTLRDLLGGADLLLSIVPPACAVDTAREVAAAMKATGYRLPYADCNAISPKSARHAGKIISEAGAVYIDGGIIIGPPPWHGKIPIFYVSGERTDPMTQLNGKGISVRV